MNVSGVFYVVMYNKWTTIGKKKKKCVARTYKFETQKKLNYVTHTHAPKSI